MVSSKDNTDVDSKCRESAFLGLLSVLSVTSVVFAILRPGDAATRAAWARQ